MKLRLRSLETKETLKLEVPTPCTFQQLKETLSTHVISSSSSSLHLSLNRKDELHVSSPDASLHSLGITSGDLIFYSLNPTAFSPQTLAPNFPNQQTLIVQDTSEIAQESQSLVLESEIGEDSGSSEKILEETVEISDSEALDMDDGSVSLENYNFSERCFLRRVLREELGGDVSHHRLLVIAIHAVLLESGFVGFNFLSGMRVDRFHLPDEWPSKAFTMSLWYTLPELLGGKNVIQSVVFKFQSLGHFVNVYGSLANGGSGLYRVCLNENRFSPAIDLVWANNSDANEKDGYPENEVFEFWKIVKDGLALPLLIELCEKTGLVPPPCFMRLPTELKLKILESLPGTDLAKVGCACTELRYLTSNNELWKQKCDEEFRGESGSNGLIPWKKTFELYWEDSKKKRKREPRLWRGFFPRVDRPFYFPVRRDPNPFGVPMVGGDYDALPGLGFPSPFRQPGGPFPRFQRRNFTPHCNLGGSNV